MQIKTSCKDCAFVEKGGPQTCMAGYLDKIKSEQLSVDNDGYYLIDGLCRGFRLPEWYKKHENSWKSRLKEENAIKYSVIINLEEDNNIWDCLTSIANQKYKPAVVHIINCSQIKFPELYRACKGNFSKWYIKQPQINIKYDDVIRKLIIQKKVSTNIMCLNGRDSLDSTSLEILNNKLDEGFKFLFVEGPNFTIFNKFLINHAEVCNIKQFLLENNYQKNIISLCT